MTSNEDNIDLEFLELQYQALSNKQISHNNLVWNAITILLVAQTFLWDISLDNTVDSITRCSVSFISMLISLASFQHFIRNRWMEIADCEQLRTLERLMLKNKNCPAMIVHHQLSERTILSPKNQVGENLENFLKMKYSDYRNSLIAQEKTFDVWKIVLVFVIIFSVYLFLYNLYWAIQMCRF